MPTKYQYNAEKRVIYATPSGELTLGEISSYVKRVLQDQEIDRAIEIVDFNNVETFKFSFSEGSNLKEIMSEATTKEKLIGSVLVAQSDFRYGMARMFSVVVGFLDKYECKAVRSIEEAEEMVKSMQKNSS